MVQKNIKRNNNQWGKNGLLKKETLETQALTAENCMQNQYQQSKENSTQNMSQQIMANKQNFSEITCELNLTLDMITLLHLIPVVMFLNVYQVSFIDVIFWILLTIGNFKNFTDADNLKTDYMTLPTKSKWYFSYRNIVSITKFFFAIYRIYNYSDYILLQDFFQMTKDTFGLRSFVISAFLPTFFVVICKQFFVVYECITRTEIVHKNRGIYLFLASILLGGCFQLSVRYLGSLETIQLCQVFATLVSLRFVVMHFKNVDSKNLSSEMIYWGSSVFLTLALTFIFSIFPAYQNLEVKN